MLTNDFIAHLFEDDLGVDDPRELELPVEQEVAAIADAQAGDEAALIDLLGAYRPVLRSVVREFSANSAMPLDDIRAEAVAAFLRVVHEHDPSDYPRLGARVGQALMQDLNAQMSASGFAFKVPDRTLTRFFGILRKADGDVEKAYELAPQHAMKQTTFLEVLKATGGVDSLEGVLFDVDKGWASGTGEGTDSGNRVAVGSEMRPVYADHEIEDADDRILVELAFSAVDDLEARICELSYGFTEGEPLPDAEVAYRVSSTRPTVQRRRNGALNKMRHALGVSSLAGGAA